MKNNKNGFALVQVLLIVGILVIIVGAVYYVVKANKDVDRALTAESSSADLKKPDSGNDAKKEEPKKTEPAPDPTAGWTLYKDPGGTYEFKYPKGWLTKDCDSLLMIAPNEESQGVCNSDGASQISLTTFTVESGQLYLDGSQYNNFTEETIQISGYDAKKQSGVYKEPGFIGPQAGDSVEQYLLNAKGTYYRISYYSLAERNFTDVKSDFELMVEKTFKIN